MADVCVNWQNIIKLYNEAGEAVEKGEGSEVSLQYSYLYS